jgi:uncharacterized protein (TIGR03437 family)
MEDVAVDVNRTSIPLYYVSPGQINAQLPFDLAPGDARLRVRNGSITTAEETFRVAATSPGAFQAALNQDSTINSAQNPERAGNIVVVFLTGIGAVAPPVPYGDLASTTVLSRATAEVSATVGGVNAEVQFAGMTPGSIGLAQVNISIPPGTLPGSQVPVAIKVGDRTSNTVSIAVR